MTLVSIYKCVKGCEWHIGCKNRSRYESYQAVEVNKGFLSNKRIKLIP
jgi:hypothetical protein